MTATDYRERLYSAYATTHSGTADQRSTEKSFRFHIAPHLPADRAARVVDIGCGQGLMVNMLTNRGYRRAEGIDVAAEQVQLARDAGIHNVRHADLADYLRQNEGELDAVLAIDVLEHFDRPALLQVMDLIYAALRPGGTLIVRSPNAVSPFSGRYRYGDLTHGLSLTPRAMQQLCAVTGFACVHVYPVDPIPTWPKGIVRAAAWKIVAAGLKGMIYAETGLRNQVVTQNLIAVAAKAG